MTNHERCMRYMAKQQAIGDDTFRFKLINKDSVELVSTRERLDTIILDDIPTFVTHLGKRCLRNKTIKGNLPESIEYIGDMVFEDSYYIGENDEFKIPKSVRILGDWAVTLDAYGKATSTSVILDIPKDNNLKSIGYYAFSGAKFKKHTLELNAIQIVGEQAFYHSDIEEVKLGNSLKEIREYAFYYCSNLRNICISGNRLKEITASMFIDTPKLDRIELPKSVTTIGGKLLQFCGTKKEIIVHSDIEVRLATQTFNITSKNRSKTIQNVTIKYID